MLGSRLSHLISVLLLILACTGCAGRVAVATNSSNVGKDQLATLFIDEFDHGGIGQLCFDNIKDEEGRSVLQQDPWERRPPTVKLKPGFYTVTLIVYGMDDKADAYPYIMLRVEPGQAYRFYSWPVNGSVNADYRRVPATQLAAGG